MQPRTIAASASTAAAAATVVRRSLGALAVAALALGSGAAAASAGTVSAEGGAVRFADTAGVRDLIHLGLGSDDAGAAWVFSTDVADPRPVAGAGCELVLGIAQCAFGATPPQSVLVDVAGGDDEVRYTSPARAATRVRILGGAGDDVLHKYEAPGELDGGDGDDTIRPDDHYSVTQLPPQPTPGDTVRGGAGTDVVEYDTTIERFAVSLDGRANDGRPGERDNVLPDVENVTGGQQGNVLVGSDGANVLTGGGAGDRLTGAGGRDTLAGGGGADTLDALDGAGGDRLDCGDGADVAYADAGDVVASRGCERTTWAPALASGRLRLRAGQIAVALRCPAAARPAGCRGTVALRSIPAGARTPLLLTRRASGAYRVRAGAGATLRLAPNRAGAAALRNRSAISVAAVVQPRGTRASAVRSVTVRG